MKLQPTLEQLRRELAGLEELARIVNTLHENCTVGARRNCAKQDRHCCKFIIQPSASNCSGDSKTS
jgi:hypothetical protein